MHKMSSCHLQQFAHVKSFNGILTYLFNNASTKEDDWNSDDWNNDWNLNSSENADKESEEDNGLVQLCLSAFSPTGDFLCFAHQDRAIFVSSSGDFSQEDLDISFKGSLNENTEEVITCVLCIPLVSLKKTSHGSRDWTCTLVGFSSGFVRMYSESGGLLISELFHESPVLEFGCRTSDTKFNKSYIGCAEHHDELTVLYADSLILLDGFSLFQTLRACRNQLALATAQGSRFIDPPPLSFKKWVLRGQEKISTHLSVGILSPSPFDQMHAASINDGFDAEVKSGATAMNQFVTGGSAPFIGFYYATEGSTEPFLSHVAIAVASRLRSALFNAASGWLSWGQKPAPEEQNKSRSKLKVEVGTGLDIRCGLPDILRNVNELIIAPGTNWIAASCDSFGRVLLIDLVKAKTLRMWKGYRDAQVGFIQSTDEEEILKKDFSSRDGSVRRMALFLVIYAPRRGILEIWSCINGPRVATFNVGKKAKLLYPGFGMFGLSADKQGDNFNTRIIQCSLLDSDGSIKELSVPFHLALSDSKSNKARDIQLLKSVSKLLQSEDQASVDGEEITKLISDMRLPSVQLQAVKKLLQSRFISHEIFENCLKEILKQFPEEELKKESKDLVIFARGQISLLNIYSALGKLNKLANTFDLLPLQDISSEEISKEFMITRKESDRILELLIELKSNRPEKVSQDRSSLAPSEFLRCLELNQSNLTLTSDHNLTASLARYTFHSSLFSRILPSDVLDTVKSNNKILNKDCLRLIFECWKSNEEDVLHNLLDSVRCLKRFVELLSNEGDEEDLKYWIRNEICYPSKNIVSAYLIALVCRSVEMAKKSNKTGSADAGDEPPGYDEVVYGMKSQAGFETLWPELESWNILTKQYEDCIIINTALCKASREKKSSLDFVSIYDLLHNGPGYIPELVSRRICELQLNADTLYTACKSDQIANEGSFLNYFRSTLLSSFPTLLSSNSIHTHCFWHEMLLWSRDAEVVDHLSRAISHVRLISDDPLLLQGLTLMGWRTFIAKIFICLAKLVEKVGKAPKDRLLRKETFMSEKSVPVFCRSVSQILQIIADSSSDKNQAPLHVESVYTEAGSNTVSDDTWNEVQGKESITTMARDQPTPNQTLLHLNMYLSFILDGVMAFSLRGVKPLSKLFNSTDRKHLTSDLAANNASIVRYDIMDADIITYRKKFLFQVVRGAVKKLCLNADNQQARDTCREWIDTCVHMGAEFHVDYSLVRVQHVCELVKHGLDEMALDNLKATGNDEQLASHLIVVIGQRLNHILLTANPEDGARMMAQMTTSVSSWIKAQNSKDLDKTDVSIESSLSVASELPAMLTEEHELYDLSEFLVEALSVVLHS